LGKFCKYHLKYCNLYNESDHDKLTVWVNEFMNDYKPNKKTEKAYIKEYNYTNIKGSSFLAQSFRIALGLYLEGYDPQHTADDKYLTINNASLTYLPLNGGTIKTSLTITNNLGIGINASAAYKLTVNGNIYSTDTIYENGIELSQKYLSISNGGTISGNIGIGTSSSPSYRLNVNGSIYSSNSVVSGGDIIENGAKLSDKYLTIANASQYLITGDFLNNQPNLQKKIGFKFVCNKPIVLNNETYYKHDINISSYVRNKYDMIDLSNYRIFNIKCFSTLGLFTTMVANKPPNILQYDVYMSSYPINICAIGFPSNYYLNKITAGDICLLKTTNYNYISVISKTNNANISCIISDFLF
jgi:hypothetical protein